MYINISSIQLITIFNSIIWYINIIINISNIGLCEDSSISPYFTLAYQRCPVYIS